MGKRSDASVAAAISDIDQRQAALLHVREVVERNTADLVERIAEAIQQAHEETFGEVARQLRAEEASVLRGERE